MAGLLHCVRVLPDKGLFAGGSLEYGRHVLMLRPRSVAASLAIAVIKRVSAYFGISTLSITWITPFEAMISA